jgi:ABC-type antimicrobial peptide transport system permease subunit
VINTAKDQINEILRQRHHIREGEESDFNVIDMQEILKRMNQSMDVFTVFLASVASISLLVGGIGIMNIMLVSVTERTREIGIRMAVGARSKHVQYQFLIESVVLGLLGGVAGILTGVGASLILSKLFNWPQLISPLAVVGSAVFSIAIGVFFGYYPARKAAALDPIEALRFE